MLCIMGGGKMGAALVGGLLAHGEEVTVVEKDAQRRDFLASEYPQCTVATEPVPCDGVIIAVKPTDVEMAVSDAVGAGAKRVLSIAAGVTLFKLHEWAGGRIPVIRAMPNIGAVVERAAVAVSPGVTAHAEDMRWADTVLSSVGTVVHVTEEHLDAVTGLSGSGPAYLFMVAEALIDAGVAAGLPYQAARDLTIETFIGAASLLSESDKSPTELRLDVSTPAGTTVAGLRVLEERSVRAAFIDAVLAAQARSRELGA